LTSASFRPSGKRLTVGNDARGISRLADLLKEEGRSPNA
jgi:hypothetical protein